MFPLHNLRAPFLVGVSLCVSACSKQDPAQPQPGDANLSQTVRGKVTYQGKALPYGFVLLYQPEKSLDPKSGTMRALSFASIGKNGDYEISAPVGHVVFCVVSDPDIPPQEIMTPKLPTGELP